MLLLTDAFKNFRDVFLQLHAVDPGHNYTYHGLPWQATFRMIEVESDLLTDIDQLELTPRERKTRTPGNTIVR